MTHSGGRYTHGHAESVLASHRRRTAADSCAYLLPRLRPGQSLLDIGAGPGTITADLARILSPGRVTALETTDEAAAHTHAGLAGVDADVVVGDVHDLTLPSDSFDVTHAHQVLQHVGDPVRALREMARVTVPGGTIAVRDSDYTAFAWWPGDPRLDQWMRLYQRAARANGGEPDAGRHLLAWAHAAGLHDVAPSASAWCMATPEVRSWWGGMWAERILTSALTDQLLDSGWATRADLEDISQAWRDWADHADGWMVLPMGELLITV